MNYEPLPGISSFSFNLGKTSSTSYETRSTVPPPASQMTNASFFEKEKVSDFAVYNAAASGSLIKVTGAIPAISAAYMRSY